MYIVDPDKDLWLILLPGGRYLEVFVLKEFTLQLDLNYKMIRHIDFLSFRMNYKTCLHFQLRPAVVQADLLLGAEAVGGADNPRVLRVKFVQLSLKKSI